MELAAKLEVVETQAADYLVRIPLAELKDKYQDHPKVVRYLDGVRESSLKPDVKINQSWGACSPPPLRWAW